MNKEEDVPTRETSEWLDREEMFQLVLSGLL